MYSYKRNILYIILILALLYLNVSGQEAGNDAISRSLSIYSGNLNQAFEPTDAISRSLSIYSGSLNAPFHPTDAVSRNMSIYTGDLNAPPVLKDAISRAITVRTSNLDLSAEEFKTPTKVTPGEIITFSWKTKCSTDNGIYPINYRDRIYITTEDNVDINNLAKYSLVTELGVEKIYKNGDIFDFSIKTKMPDTIGLLKYRLFLIIDVNNGAYDPNRMNNLIISDEITVVDDSNPLPIGDERNAQITLPQTQQRWLFEAERKSLIRFNLTSQENPVLNFKLTGPNGWIGFIDQAGDSDLIALPYTGTYYLTAYLIDETFSQVNYSFILEKYDPIDLVLNQAYNGNIKGNEIPELFKIDINTEKSIKIKLDDSANTGQNELYVRYGMPPTRKEYDYISSIQNSVDQTITIPKAMNGPWYILLYPKSNSKSSYSLTVSYSEESFLTELKANVSASNMVTPDYSKYYYIDLYANENLLVQIEPLLGARKLSCFIKYGDLPTLFEYDYKSEYPTVNGKYELLISPAKIEVGKDTGRYYILINGADVDISGGNYKITASLLPKYVSEINPKTVTNLGQALIGIKGLNFREMKNIKIIDPISKVEIYSSSISIISDIETQAVFNLAGTSIGKKDLKIIWQNGEEILLLKALEVKSDYTSKVQINVNMPEYIRPNRNYTCTIEYKNIGTDEIPALLLGVEGSPTICFKPPWENGFSNNVFQFLAVGDSYPVNMLIPGKTYKFSCLFRTTSNIAHSIEKINVKELTTKPELVNWDGYMTQLKPQHVSEEDWFSAWENIKKIFGNTWYDYHQGLLTRGNRIFKMKGNPSNISEIIAMMVDEALGKPIACIQGKVVNIESYRPLGYTMIKAYDTDMELVGYDYSDESGFFTIQNLPDGKYNLYAESVYEDEVTTYTIQNQEDIYDIIIWGKPPVPYKEPEPVEEPEFAPKLVADNNGNAWMIYNKGSKSRIVKYSEGTWINDQELPEGIINIESATWIDDFGDGLSKGIYAVWSEGDTKHSQLACAAGKINETGYFDWSTTQPLSTNNYLNVFPVVDTMNNGKPIVVWMQKDGTIMDDYDLYYQYPEFGEMLFNGMKIEKNEIPITKSSSDEGCASFAFNSGTDIPIPFVGGKYEVSVAGEYCGNFDRCSGKQITGNLDLELTVANDTYGGGASLSESWAFIRSATECKYVFNSRKVTGRLSRGYTKEFSPYTLFRTDWKTQKLLDPVFRLICTINASIGGSLSLVYTEESGISSGNVTTELSGSISGGFAIPEMAKVEVSGAANANYEVHYPFDTNINWDFCMSYNIGVSDWLTLSWKWCENSEDKEKLSLIDDIDIIIVKNFRGTNNIYEGIHLENNINNNYSSDKWPKISVNKNSGNIVCTWFKESENFNSNLGSSVNAAIRKGSNWEFETIDGNFSFNRYLKLCSFGNDDFIAVWSASKYNNPLTTESSVDEILETMNKTEIYYSIRNNNSWSSPQSITNNGGYNSNCIIEKDSNENILLVWIKKEDTVMYLYSSLWNGINWSTPTLISSSSIISCPDLKKVKDKLLLVWSENKNNSDILYLKYSLWDGNQWNGSNNVSERKNKKESMLFAIRNNNKLINELNSTETKIIEQTLGIKNSFMFNKYRENSKTDKNLKVFFNPGTPPPDCCQTPIPTPTPTPCVDASCQVPPCDNSEGSSGCGCGNPPPPAKNVDRTAKDSSHGGNCGGGGENVLPNDPNEKTGPAGIGLQRYLLNNNNNLIYTIYFENIASASASAQEIFITDELDPGLDWNSFTPLDVVFSTNTLVLQPVNGYAHTDIPIDNKYIARVQCLPEKETGKVLWSIRMLDRITEELPEDVFAGILPPNDALGRGEGHVTFSINKKTNLPNGTIIKNRASIVFDTNQPIITNEVFNTIDLVPPQSSVNNLPSDQEGSSIVHISWKGSDIEPGSGISTYDIYVSKDYSQFEVLLEDTILTEYDFSGEVGHTYSFYSIAKDNAGNVELPPSTPDAKIRIKSPYIPDSNSWLLVSTEKKNHDLVRYNGLKFSEYAKYGLYENNTSLFLSNFNK